MLDFIYVELHCFKREGKNFITRFFFVVINEVQCSEVKFVLDDEVEIFTCMNNANKKCRSEIFSLIIFIAVYTMYPCE